MEGASLPTPHGSRQTNWDIRKPSNSTIISGPSPTSQSSSLSGVNNHTMIKSMENVLSEKSRSWHKRLSARIRRNMPLKEVSEFKYFPRQTSNLSFERIKAAKLKVNEAIQKGKVFTVLGPYDRIRQILRNRGWVEKFYFNSDVLNNFSIRKCRSSIKVNGFKMISFDEADDDCDDADDDYIDDDNIDGDETHSSGVFPWEEDDGIYEMMSRMLKRTEPNLVWTLRKSKVDYKNLRRDQIFNHHAKAGLFTTKTGLIKCLNQLRWFDDKEPDEFFPRCFIISTVEEKNAFIEDFRFTACTSLVKEVIEDSKDPRGDLVESFDTSNNGKTCEVMIDRSNKKILPKIKYCDKRKERSGVIDHKFLEMAIAYCEFILKVKCHKDIDGNNFLFCWDDCDWDDFLNNYYKVVNEGFRIKGADNEETLVKCSKIATELKKKFPQFDMEGSRNVWILKPGAKSRGRGIMCYSRLNDVLKLLSQSCVNNENKFIVQKYIERPLLIYNTKFDIRQWFMVTDWNPLTVWWYRDCYLRFCSQQYTLDDFNEAVHLSNNSIQHKYYNGPRSEFLPAENMWDWIQFEKWMKSVGFGNAYSSIILPGMKEAIIDVLMCVQDSVECRKDNMKNTFELYGADFMVSNNDLKPWLIEINSCPSMSPSTTVTARLTAAVLEDIFKVILDRRENKQCDTGGFELVYKQNPIFVPPYVGIDLKLLGTSIKNPCTPTMLNEGRTSSRLLSDSLKKKYEGSLIRPTIDNAPLSRSVNSKKDLISKVMNISKSISKRSNTSIVLNSSRAKLRSAENKLSFSHFVPISTSIKIPITSISTECSKRQYSTNANIQITNSRKPDIKYDDSAVDKKFSYHRKSFDEETESTIGDDNSISSQSELIVKSTKLPTNLSLECSSALLIKSLEQKLRFPTKVELVNLSDSKGSTDTSPKEEKKLQKKRKNNKSIKRSLKSCLSIQNFTSSKLNSTCQSYHRSFDKSVNYKRTLSIVNEKDVKSHSGSKASIFTRLLPCTSTQLSKFDENDDLIASIVFRRS